MYYWSGVNFTSWICYWTSTKVIFKDNTSNCCKPCAMSIIYCPQTYINIAIFMTQLKQQHWLLVIYNTTEGITWFSGVTGNEKQRREAVIKPKLMLFSTANPTSRIFVRDRRAWNLALEVMWCLGRPFPCALVCLAHCIIFISKKNKGWVVVCLFALVKTFCWMGYITQETILDSTLTTYIPIVTPSNLSLQSY